MSWQILKNAVTIGLKYVLLLTNDSELKNAVRPPRALSTFMGEWRNLLERPHGKEALFADKVLSICNKTVMEYVRVIQKVQTSERKVIYNMLVMLHLKLPKF